MNDNILFEMLAKAKEIAQNNTCCKHTKYTVGTALLTEDNQIITGCNIENHGLMSICAERVAFCKALSEGINKFTCIVIVGKNLDGLFIETLPCGYCRQFMSEYCKKDFVIYSYDEQTNVIKKYKLSDLLPYSYSFEE